MKYSIAVLNAVVFIGLVYFVTRGPPSSAPTAPQPQLAPKGAHFISAGSIAGIEELVSGSFAGIEAGKKERVEELARHQAPQADPPASDRKSEGKINLPPGILEMQTYAANNNIVEQRLPTVAPQTAVEGSAELGGKAIELPPEAGKIDLAIGVLTAPALLYSRLIPLLETSLLHEKNVYVFFEKNKKTLDGQKALKEYLVSAGREKDVSIIQLPPLDNMLMSIRNAWVDIPGFLAMRDLLPKQEFFAIMDDDTYFLMNAIRLILHETMANETLRNSPLYIGSSIGFGEKHGWRVIRNPRTGTRSILPSTRRTPITYVVGGSGIIVNRLSLDRVNQFKEACLSKHLEPAGDIRLGYCMAEAEVPIHNRREMIRESWFRAVGELDIASKRRFPASFHGCRRREWFYSMRAVEQTRKSNELVTWDDIKINFPVGAKYYDALFRPSQYSNWSTILGLTTRSPSQMARYLKRQKILNKMGFKEKKEGEHEF
jgi:hypothetical protein